MNKEKKTLAIQAYTFFKARFGVRACTLIIEETTILGRCFEIFIFLFFRGQFLFYHHYFVVFYYNMFRIRSIRF